MTASHPNDDSEFDPLLRQAVDELRAPVTARPAARAALHAALRAEAIARTVREGVADVVPTHDARARRPLGWLTTTRSMRISPLGLLAAASLLVATTAVITTRATTPTIALEGNSPVAAPPTSTQVVRFSLAAPQARRVSLVGDFNGWDPTATTLQQRNGTWTVVIPVTAGRHQYGFVVDGTEWIADPAGVRSADSDFGSANSIVYVGS